MTAVPPSEARSGRPGALVLGLAAALAFGLTVWGVALDPNPELHDDALQYRAIGLHWSQEGIYSLDGTRPTALRMPAYPLFVALVARLAGPGLAPLRIAQGLLGGLDVLLAWGLAGVWIRRRWAAAFALFAVALHPLLLFSNLQVLRESLTTPLFLLFLLLWTRGRSRPSSSFALLSGIPLGLFGLSGGVELGLIPLVPVLSALAPPRRRSLVRGMGAALVALVLYAPWPIRNRIVFHRTVLTSTHNAAWVLPPEAGPVDDRATLRHFAGDFRASPPRFIRAFLAKSLSYWSHTDFPTIPCGATLVARWRGHPFRLGRLAPLLALFPLTLLGFAVAFGRDPPSGAFLGGVALYFTVAHGFTWVAAAQRYRIALLPIEMVLAGLGLEALPRLLARGLAGALGFWGTRSPRARRAYAAAAALSALFALSVRYRPAFFSQLFQSDVPPSVSTYFGPPRLNLERGCEEVLVAAYGPEPFRTEIESRSGRVDAEVARSAALWVPVECGGDLLRARFKGVLGAETRAWAEVSPCGACAGVLSGPPPILLGSLPGGAVREVTFPEGAPASMEGVDPVLVLSPSGSEVAWDRGTWLPDLRAVELTLRAPMEILSVEIEAPSPYDNYRIDRVEVRLARGAEPFAPAATAELSFFKPIRGLHRFRLGPPLGVADRIRIVVEHEADATRMVLRRIAVWARAPARR